MEAALSPHDAAALLRWYVDHGLDETIGEEAIDRFALPPPAAIVATPAPPTVPPSAAPTPIRPPLAAPAVRAPVPLESPQLARRRPRSSPRAPPPSPNWKKPCAPSRAAP